MVFERAYSVRMTCGMEGRRMNGVGIILEIQVCLAARKQVERAIAIMDDHCFAPRYNIRHY